MNAPLEPQLESRCRQPGCEACNLITPYPGYCIGFPAVSGVKLLKKRKERKRERERGGWGGGAREREKEKVTHQGFSLVS